MDILYALKMTGKATTETETAGFVSVGEDGILYWFNRLTGKKMLAVKLEVIGRNDWLPYHPKEEIRPKEAGELWKNKYGQFFAIGEDAMGLYVCWLDKPHPGPQERELDRDTACMLHGKNGWERVFPVVEDAEGTHRDSDTKTIIIKDVKWVKDNYPTYSTYHPELTGLTIAEHEDLLTEEPMTLTLTMKKKED